MDLFGEPDPPEKPVIEEDLTQPAAEEGLFHPRAMDICLGHEAQEQELFGLIEENRLPHGLIFAGTQGIGKATFAYRLAKHLFQDSHAALVTSGGHPDLLSIERQLDTTGKPKSTLDVAEIRKVGPFLQMTSSMDGWRVVVVDDADTMNRNAQNALLKVLEEPPANTVLILVTHCVGALIPTIRSRSRVIHFSSPNEEVFGQLLAKQGHILSPEKQKTLYQLSGQSFGKALELLDEGGLEVLDRILALFQNHPDWDYSTIHDFAEELGRRGQEQSYAAFEDMMLALSQSLTVAKARALPSPAEPFDQDIFVRILQNSSLENLSKICENLQVHFDRVQRSNLDKRSGVTEAFAIMRAA